MDAFSPPSLRPAKYQQRTSELPVDSEETEIRSMSVNGIGDSGAALADAKKRRRVILKRRLKFPLCAAIVQMALLALFARFAGYPLDADTRRVNQCQMDKLVRLRGELNWTSPDQPLDCPAEEPVHIYGSPYQDAQFFIVTGLTLLFMGVRHHNMTTMALCMFVLSLSLQWSFICRGFFRWEGPHDPIKPSTDLFVITVFFAAAVLISWGVVLGRTSPMQVLLMTMCEIPPALANDYLILDVFKVNDPGGALIYNVFGTYFGLGVSRMLHRAGEGLHEQKRESTVYSESFAFLGSTILWGFWPTAMGAIFTGHQRHRCILNTYFALTGSGVMGTVASVALDPEGRFTASHVQNAILAGAVAMSGAADSMMGLFFAVLVGGLAGIVSALTWAYIQPFLARRCGIVDTCGSHTLHGVPAILGVVVSAVVACLATEETYGSSLYKLFPAMAPVEGSEALSKMREVWPDVKAGEGRTAYGQALYQLAALGTTFLAALASGLITGLLMRHKFFDPPEEENYYADEPLWNMPEGEPKAQRRWPTADHGVGSQPVTSYYEPVTNASKGSINAGFTGEDNSVAVLALRKVDHTTKF